MTKNVWLIGLKVWVVSIITGIIVSPLVILNAYLVITTPSIRILISSTLYLIILALSIFLLGFFANKIWKWR